MSADIAFWQRKRLHEMTDSEWESLCDGCGRCCLHKLQDEDDDSLHFTDVACRHLDSNACQCRVYPNRLSWVKDCLDVQTMSGDQYHWLPVSCAYRRLHEGRPLAHWHPLVSGDPDSVHKAGISVRDRVISEDELAQEDWQERLIHWVE
ncbi:MAG: YcgN family cysteine cluster protein [Halomonadaceae bacterium]|nr:MAG: YcgN family cysteine cluster protein [Halomonadaceae bacterium]